MGKFEVGAGTWSGSWESRQLRVAGAWLLEKDEARDWRGSQIVLSPGGLAKEPYPVGMGSH